MDEDDEPRNVELDHFIYGSHEGYKIKAFSSNVDVKMFEDAFQGFFIPISQADVKHISDVRMILPAGDKYICLSHIIPGPKDEYQRKTLANHTAIIPRKLLAEGTISYDDVDSAMATFGEGKGEIIGPMPKLKVDFEGWGVDMADLKSSIKKEDLEKLMGFYKADKDDKVFLKYSNSDPKLRNSTAYLLSMFIDIGLHIVPLSIFTDVPYPEAKKIFNLVIARGMISIKPGQGWRMLPINAPPPDSNMIRSGKDPIKDIYG